MLTEGDALAAAQSIADLSRAEDTRLENIAAYLAGTYPSTVYVPRKAANKAAQQEYAGIVSRSRQPVLSLVVDTIAQNLYVDGYRPARSAVNGPGWEHWQSNRMDARQAGIHRAAVGYGAAYLIILPGEGDADPIWRPVSPRRMRAVYADRVNDEWPVLALEEWTEGTKIGMVRRFRLYDATHTYEFRSRDAVPAVQWSRPAGPPGATATIPTIPASVVEMTDEPSEHGSGVCPVVRYVGTADLDGEYLGEVEPLIPLQQQIDAGTYYIEMAQQYAVHRQRWSTGLAIPEDDSGNPKEPFDAAVDRLWVAEDPDTKFGEFSQTEVKPWLDARESVLRAIAIKSQTPPGYLLGEMSNLSAEALAATEAPSQRRADGYRTLFGEAHEQAFRLDALQSGDPDGWENTSAQVVWRDTESRSLAQVADALGKLAASLEIPPMALWEKIPGVTDQDIAAWESLRKREKKDAAKNAALSFGIDTAAQPEPGPPVQGQQPPPAQPVPPAQPPPVP